MARWRLGVVLLIPEPWSTEIQGLRRALGDGAIERIAPHITLVPPVNVNVSDGGLGRVLSLVRRAAEATAGPLALELGPVDTFAPDTPVVKLAVSGDHLHQLRGRVFVGELERTLTWPFVPHVTLADDAGPVQLQYASDVLHGYRASISIDRIHVLRQMDNRVWMPIADAAFEPPAVIGRGGFEIELATSTLVDPIAGELIGSCNGVPDLVVTARLHGDVSGVVAARLHAGTAEIIGLCVHPHLRKRGIGSHLLRHLLSEAARKGADRARLACSPSLDSDLTTFAERLGFDGEGTIALRSR